MDNNLQNLSQVRREIETIQNDLAGLINYNFDSGNKALTDSGNPSSSLKLVKSDENASCQYVNSTNQLTYKNIIKMCLSIKPATLRNIYRWISDNFPEVTVERKNWKNSIHRTLCRKPEFKKVKVDGCKTDHWSMKNNEQNLCDSDVVDLPDITDEDLEQIEEGDILAPTEDIFVDDKFQNKFLLLDDVGCPKSSALNECIQRRLQFNSNDKNHTETETGNLVAGRGDLISTNHKLTSTMNNSRDMSQVQREIKMSHNDVAWLINCNADDVLRSHSSALNDYVLRRLQFNCDDDESCEETGIETDDLTANCDDLGSMNPELASTMKKSKNMSQTRREILICQNDLGCLINNGGDSVVRPLTESGNLSNFIKVVKLDENIIFQLVKRAKQWTYADLIEMSLSRKPLTLQQIYNWISINFPEVTAERKSWKNSIRHTLSMRPEFKRVKLNDYRGTWTVKKVWISNYY